MTCITASNQQYLRAECDVLTNLVAELDAEPVDGADLRARLVQRRQHNRRQLARFMSSNGRCRRPVVLDPAQFGQQLSLQGQPLTPVITAEVAATEGLSSAQVCMPPHHTSFAHVHHHTGVSVLILEGSAITLWWDDDGKLHELPQVARQHLYIPHSVPHAAINPYPVPLVAAEFRNNPVFNADNERLPELDAEVAERMAILDAAG